MPRAPGQTLEMTPAKGGRLMASMSSEAGGVGNYVVKRDFRRYKDREIRAEGYDAIQLSLAMAVGDQQYPPGVAGAITLVKQAERTDGKRTFIVGTPATLWAYTALEDWEYFTGDLSGSGYFVPGYFDESASYGWIQIGSGYTATANRWEAEAVSDWLCLNNGIDLPVTYRVGDLAVKPIYELREQGIASVGTITAFNGILFVFDCWIIKDTYLPTWMNGSTPYGTFTDTDNMSRFPGRSIPSMPGLPRRWGATVPVSAALDGYQLQLQYPVASLAELLSENNWGGMAGTTRIVVTYAATGAGTLTTQIVWINGTTIQISDAIENPIVATSTLPTGGQVSVLEAFDSSSSYAGAYVDLIGEGTPIIKAKPLRDQLVVYKSEPMIYLGTYTGDSLNPMSFQEIPIANASAIPRYRNCIIAGGGGYYGSYHIYAGRDAFYKFDLFLLTPAEQPEFQTCQGLFFAHAAADPENAWVEENPLTKEWFFGWSSFGQPDRALCYDFIQKTLRTTAQPITAAARVRHPTRGDWLFLFGSDDGSVNRYGLYDAPVENPAVTVTYIPATAASPALLTASGNYFTTAHVGKTALLGQVTAGTIELSDILSSDITGIFAITGYVSPTQVQVIGVVPIKCGVPMTWTATSFAIVPAIWHWNQSAYDSTLESCLDGFSFAHGEKMVNEWVLIPGSNSPNTPVAVSFKAARNPAKPEWMRDATIDTPDLSGNLLRPTLQAHYLGDRIVVSGLNNPFALVSRIWNVIPVATHSFVRGKR